MLIKYKQLWFGPLIVILVFVFHYSLKNNLNKHNDSSAYKIDFKLEEESKKIGLVHRHNLFVTQPEFKNVAKWVESMGAGITIADFNADGFMDVLLNDNSPDHLHSLFINDHHGSFKNMTEEFKIRKWKYKISNTKIITFDCNNDGYSDLFIQSLCPIIFINKNGQYFEDYTKESGIGGCSSPVVASNAFDYDKDGNLDLIWGSYFANDPFFQNKKTEGIIPDNFNDSKNAATIFLKKGDGQCHFTDKSQLLSNIVHDRGWHIDIGPADIFGDNQQDIWLATDYGITHPQRFISPEKGWKDESDLVDRPTKTRNSMGVNISDIDHNLRNNIFLPNIYREKEKINGNLLWEYDSKTNSFIEKGIDYNINRCGWAWGSQLVDLNNDTWDDLVVTNGMIGDGSLKSYWYTLSVLDSSGRGFMGDIKNWPDMNKYDLEGGQKDCIFINQKKGQGFVESTPEIFDLDKKNGRAVAYIDINNDGVYHLIVANQDDFVKAYKVKATSKYKWFGVDLKTKNHNSFSWGAKIFWTLSDGTKSFKEMRPIQGHMAQNDPRFRLAFPESLSLTQLSIEWLDGYKQEINLNSILMNQYNVIAR